MSDLRERYQAAAQKAFADGVGAGDQEQLAQWIRANCRYDAQNNEFYLVLGIGCALADLRAQEQGYENEVHRAFVVAEQKCDKRNNGNKVGEAGEVK